MTTTPETRPCLIFNPPEDADDTQVLVALFTAASLVSGAAEPFLGPIGEVVVGVPIDLHQRASRIRVRGTSLLDYVRMNCQSEMVVVPDPAAPSADHERWRDGAAALAREGIVEIGAAQGPGEFFKALRAELGQLREDLRVEEGKVARLTEELARRLAQVAEARVAEFDPGSIEAYQQEIVDRVSAIPGVLRVHWPQWGMLRAIVAISPDVPNQRESLEIQIEGVIDDPEIEHCVQEEPGTPAPGYKVRGGHADSAEAPTLRWYWRHSSDGIEHEQGPLASEAAAVDATWEESARDGEPEMEP